VPADVTRVFVYGTLMPGHARWPALAPFATAWAPATARGRLWDTGRGYPAVRFEATAALVPGFLVDLDATRAPEAVARLDRIEAEGSLYRRIEIVTSGGPALTYEWLGATDGLPPLHEGWPRR
jgi:gamma-glutamylcyclotransferase (GGCT)/AIG2-like uncharacterized protein YtfP